MATVPEKLKQVRKEAGVSANFMGERLGVNPQTYRRWESGETHIPYHEYCRVMAMFGYDVVEVKDFRENKL